MASDVMSVRLRRVMVLEVTVDAPERLALRVASAVSRPRCRDWGTPSGRCHDRRAREIRDLEISGRPVTLMWERRPMVGAVWDRRFVETRRAFEGRVRALLERRLVADAPRMTVNAPARRHQVGWGLADALAAFWARLVGEHLRRRRCGVLLAERTSILKRHRCVRALVIGDAGEVLAMAPHPNTRVLSGFVPGKGHTWREGVKAVGSDGSKAHKTTTDQRLGHARRVLDRSADIHGSGQVPEFSDTVDTFLAWHAQILDWHRTRWPSNGRIEATNNLLQVPRRKAHGFTNYTNFEARGLLLTRTPPNPAVRTPKETKAQQTTERRIALALACSVRCEMNARMSGWCAGRWQSAGCSALNDTTMEAPWQLRSTM